MKGQLKVTDKQILRHVAAGDSQAKIARQYGVSRSAMSQRFKSLGISSKKSERVPITFIINPDTARFVDEIASKTNQLKGEVVEAAVAHYLRRIRKSK